MGKCKTKSIQVYLDIFMYIQAYLDMFRHDQAYSGIIQGYSKSCITLAYSEPSYIQEPGVFRTRHIPRTLAYSVQNHRHIQNPAKNLRWSVLEK